MVFFNKRMTRTVVVPPDHLGAGLKDYVRALLIANVEGMPLDDFGYIISVLEVNEAGMTHGLIDHFTGSVKYNVDFRALVFRPFRNEVLDGVVISVTQVRRQRGLLKCCPASARLGGSSCAFFWKEPPPGKQLPLNLLIADGHVGRRWPDQCLYLKRGAFEKRRSIDRSNAILAHLAVAAPHPLLLLLLFWKKILPH